MSVLYLQKVSRVLEKYNKRGGKMKKKKFQKDAVGKLRYDLIPPDVLMQIAKVLTNGAEKYEANSWRDPEDAQPHTAAAMRHFEAWRRGEKLDDESGLPHLAHAITNLIFLYENGF